MSGFLTVEDINGTVFNNQGFWWHVIDTADLPTVPFTDIKYDFCTISMTTGVETYHYNLKIDNSLWTHGVYALQNNGEIGDVSIYYVEQTNELGVSVDDEFIPIRIFLYMGPRTFSTGNDFDLIDYVFVDGSILNLNYKQLNTPQSIRIMHRETEEIVTLTETLVQGYNEFNSMTGDYDVGFLLVNLLKTDFQFTCTDTVYLGKVNTVRLGTDTDYKPNGDLIGEYTPVITVEYGNETLPVVWDNTLNDYTFQLDLTNQNDLSKVKFKVKVEANTVLNSTVTEVTLTPSIETITTFNQLQAFMMNGGIAELNNLIYLSNDVVVKNDAYLIGGASKSINLNQHSIIVDTDKTLKIDNCTLFYGTHSIIQNTGSQVELNKCTIFNTIVPVKYPYGSVIYCNIDLESLDNPTDFHTTINDCTFSNCGANAILHGGELNITNSIILINNKSAFKGVISATGDYKELPFFIYQTDGTATIQGCTFTIRNINSNKDLGFIPAIFCCGENATINGLNYTQLQNNNVISFLERNQSNIEGLTYYYAPIEDNITLTASNGFCHCVSGVDYVFKTNVTINRSG